MKKNLINDQNFLKAMEDFNHYVYQWDLDLYSDEKYVGLYYSESQDSFMVIYADNLADPELTYRERELWASDYHLVYHEDVYDIDPYWDEEECNYYLPEEAKEDIENFVQNRIDKIQEAYDRIECSCGNLINYIIDQYDSKILKTREWYSEEQYADAKEELEEETAIDIYDSMVYEVDNEDYPVKFIYGDNSIKEIYGDDVHRRLYKIYQDDINEQFYVIKNPDLIQGLEDSPYVLYKHDDRTAFIKTIDKDDFRFSEEVLNKLKETVDQKINEIVECLDLDPDLDQVLAAADAVEDQGRDHFKQSNLER